MIIELLNLLPVSARFTAGVDEEASYAQAIRNGWSATQLAEGIEQAAVGPGVRSASAVAVTVLHRLAGQSPPPQKKAAALPSRMGMPLPECSVCGQPFQVRTLGVRGGPCPDCEVDPILLVQFDPRTQRVIT